MCPTDIQACRAPRLQAAGCKASIGPAAPAAAVAKPGGQPTFTFLQRLRTPLPPKCSLKSKLLPQPYLDLASTLLLEKWHHTQNKKVEPLQPQSFFVYFCFSRANLRQTVKVVDNDAILGQKTHTAVATARRLHPTPARMRQPLPQMQQARMGALLQQCNCTATRRKCIQVETARLATRSRQGLVLQTPQQSAMPGETGR